MLTIVQEVDFLMKDEMDEPSLSFDGLHHSVCYFKTFVGGTSGKGSTFCQTHVDKPIIYPRPYPP